MATDKSHEACPRCSGLVCWQSQIVLEEANGEMATVGTCVNCGWRVYEFVSEQYQEAASIVEAELEVSLTRRSAHGNRKPRRG